MNRGIRSYSNSFFSIQLRVLRGKKLTTDSNSKETQRKNILITNDDGYFSPGITALARELKKSGKVTIVAPDRERSAIGHGMTFFKPLRLVRIREEENLRIFSCNGTPTDCIMLGTNHLMSGKTDMIVSGINSGGNIGDDITYSGTVAGALEGTIQGIPSMAVSLNTIEKFDFSAAARFAAATAKLILEKGLPDGVFLNINLPAVKSEEIKGVKITFQGRSIYRQKIIKRIDPRGAEYFWMAGSPPKGEPVPGSDFWAIANNYISITPLHLSLTRMEYIDKLKEWNFDSWIS